MMHPSALPPEVFPPAQYASDHQPSDCRTLVQQCSGMCHAPYLLAAATMYEAGELCQHPPRPTQAVPQAGGPSRNVPYMHEISFIIGHGDSSVCTDCILGHPTVKWALHAPTRVPREHWPVSTIQDLLTGVMTTIRVPSHTHTADI